LRGNRKILSDNPPLAAKALVIAGLSPRRARKDISGLSLDTLMGAQWTSSCEG
jgi:hypothetical protein